MARPGKVYSEHDATSMRALQDLMQSIEAVPIRSLKPTKPKGRLYLVNFHNSTSTCLISRLPSNLIRLLISYNTFTELMALTLTCRQFSKFMFDKYIQFSGEMQNVGLYQTNVFTFKDQFDLLRLENCKNARKLVKVYGSIRPEITGIFHVNTRTDQFYAYYEGSILEGTFDCNSDTMEIKSTRPCIAGVLLTDVSNEAIICASSTELALSLPTSLRQATMNFPGPPLFLHFIANRRLILVVHTRKIEIYHSTLALTQTLETEEWVNRVYIPDTTKPVFATLSTDQVNCYSISSNCELHRTFHHERQFLTNHILDLLICRHTHEGHHYDFLITLLDNGEVRINSKPIETTGWSKILLYDNRLFFLRKGAIHVYQFSEEMLTFVSVSSITLNDSFDYKLIQIARMKVVTVTLKPHSVTIDYYEPVMSRLVCCNSVTLPISEGKVTITGPNVVVTGNIQVEWENEEVEKVNAAYVVDFNRDSMLGRLPDLISQASLALQERKNEELVRKQKRIERKRIEKAENARKKEEMQNKHRPKH